MSIKCILDDVRLSYIWNNQLCNNTKWIVKSTLRDQYIQKWHANIDSSSKGVTYKTFKTIFLFREISIVTTTKAMETNYKDKNIKSLFTS